MFVRSKTSSSFILYFSFTEKCIVIIFIKMESKHEAAQAYVDAGNCYKKISVKGSTSAVYL